MQNRSLSFFQRKTGKITAIKRELRGFHLCGQFLGLSAAKMIRDGFCEDVCRNGLVFTACRNPFVTKNTTVRASPIHDEDRNNARHGAKVFLPLEAALMSPMIQGARWLSWRLPVLPLSEFLPVPDVAIPSATSRRISKVLSWSRAELSDDAVFGDGMKAALADFL